MTAAELTEPRSAAHLREPEFSQPLVTALQLCIVVILMESTQLAQALEHGRSPVVEDHKMGANVLLPGSGFICMAVETMWQKKNATDPDEAVTSPNQLAYRLRNIRFDKALVLEDDRDVEVLLWLTEQPGRQIE